MSGLKAESAKQSGGQQRVAGFEQAGDGTSDSAQSECSLQVWRSLQS